jgi:hypothetical protein
MESRIMHLKCHLPVASRTDAGVIVRPGHEPDALDEIARFYGFDSGEELIAISKPCPKQPEETAQCYVARQANGHWCIWTEELPPEAPREPRYPTTF